jgi:hypothetical protein
MTLFSVSEATRTSVDQPQMNSSRVVSRGSTTKLGCCFQLFRIKNLEMVAQIFPRWNRMASSLREAERYLVAA